MQAFLYKNVIINKSLNNKKNFWIQAILGVKMLVLVLFTLLLTLQQASPPQYLLIKIPQSYAISQTYATVFFEVQFEYSPILKSYNQVNTEGNAVEYTVTCPSGTSTGTYEFSPFISPYGTLLPLSVFIPSRLHRKFVNWKSV